MTQQLNNNQQAWRYQSVGLVAWTAILLNCLAMSEAQAAVVLTGGGLVLAQEGPAAAAAGGLAPVNLATGATAISHGDLSGFGHLTIELNDGVYGNASSWIGDGPVPTSGPYAGISLGPSTMNIQSFAFGRSNVLSGDPCAGGVCTDRSLGLYNLQYTMLPNPTGAEAVTGNAATGWESIGTLDYQSPGGALFSAPHQRHRFNFDAVDATGLRLIVPTSGLSGGTAIDEFEIYSAQVPPVTITSNPGFSVTWDGNDGDFFDAGVPANVPDNLALAANGSTAFGSGQLSGDGGIHDIDNVIDGQYGNSNSWIHGGNEVVVGVDAGTFVGVTFGDLVAIDAIAFGRDNGNGDIDDNPSGTDGCGGQCDDRSLGSYLLQYTLLENADATTSSTGDPLTGWADIATIDYGFGEDDLLGAGFTEYLRHQFEVSLNGLPLQANAIRIVTSDPAIAIDEIEVIGTVVPEPASITIWGVLGVVLLGFGWRHSCRLRCES